MQIISTLEKINIKENTAVAIGKFDGIHLGHRLLLNELLKQKENGLSTVVFTFNPSPSVFFGLSDEYMLTTDEEKRELLEKLGIDYLIEFPFDKNTAAMEPEYFIADYLVSKIKAKYIIAGDDMSFGKGGKGNIDLLISKSKECGYEAKKISKISIDNNIVSSTLIRSFVSEGKMEKFREYTGEEYSIKGVVVHGRKLGRTLGFPTINIFPDEYKLLPPNGVYYSKVLYNGISYDAISNIGTKPTVSQDETKSIETHLYNFNEDIYGKELRVYLLSFKRPEQKFASVSELKAVLSNDISDGKKYFGINY